MQPLVAAVVIGQRVVLGPVHLRRQGRILRLEGRRPLRIQSAGLRLVLSRPILRIGAADLEVWVLQKHQRGLLEQPLIRLVLGGNMRVDGVVGGPARYAARLHGLLVLGQHRLHEVEMGVEEGRAVRVVGVHVQKQQHMQGLVVKKLTAEHALD
ncbi:unnamed protein product [Phytomonas sp. Hart1]|nr:unnamed protein product [Phytomonas sp. Hart1]|eukprot:CCW71891.1 unnamed protein product [Phytomonas sp. isolate Hart1]